MDSYENTSRRSLIWFDSNRCILHLPTGLFSEGTNLFAQSQQAYGDLLEASRQGSGFAPPGYGVGSVPLVDVALRCCAQGQ